MDITPHLAFDGTCEEAFRFYPAGFGGTLQTLLRYRQMTIPGNVPAGFADKIAHATLRVGAATLMGNDVRPGDYARSQGFAVALGISDPAAAKRTFDVLADGGVITLPLAETFWALAFGAVVDRFGVTREINCERPARRQVPVRGRKRLT
jgi:PhnB protein